MKSFNLVTLFAFIVCVSAQTSSPPAFACVTHTFASDCVTANITNVSYVVDGPAMHAFLNKGFTDSEAFATSNWTEFNSTAAAIRDPNVCHGAFLQLQCSTVRQMFLPLCFPNGTFGLQTCYGTCVNFHMACFNLSSTNASNICSYVAAPQGENQCIGTSAILLS
eukprot:GGOE01065043.1.p1 GENE.GGOE01065043.1~~GGOE01065043.1.p1  ORF type:complete len:176 (+),score=25.93 GGOE01065043.1:36-530(+)